MQRALGSVPSTERKKESHKERQGGKEIGIGGKRTEKRGGEGEEREQRRKRVGGKKKRQVEGRRKGQKSVRKRKREGKGEERLKKSGTTESNPDKPRCM